MSFGNEVLLRKRMNGLSFRAGVDPPPDPPSFPNMAVTDPHRNSFSVQSDHSVLEMAFP